MICCEGGRTFDIVAPIEYIVIFRAERLCCVDYWFCAVLPSQIFVVCSVCVHCVLYL